MTNTNFTALNGMLKQLYKQTGNAEKASSAGAYRNDTENLLRQNPNLAGILEFELPQNLTDQRGIPITELLNFRINNDSSLNSDDGYTGHVKRASVFTKGNLTVHAFVYDANDIDGDGQNDEVYKVFVNRTDNFAETFYFRADSTKAGTPTAHLLSLDNNGNLRKGRLTADF